MCLCVLGGGGSKGSCSRGPRPKKGPLRRYCKQHSCEVSGQTDQNSSRYRPFLLPITWGYQRNRKLFLLKKRPKSAFQPMKVCSKSVCLEVSWVDFECFYALLWRSRWLLNVFVWLLLTFLTIFEPFVTLSGAGPFWGDFGPFFGLIRGHSGIIFGIILASFRCRVDPILRPF